MTVKGGTAEPENWPQDGDRLPVEFMARRDEWNDGVSLYLRQRTVGEGETVAAPIVMIQRESMTMVVEPMLRLRIQSAQQLMDELWQCGLRPSEGSGSAGAMAATQRHLDDMRSIALGALRKAGVST